MIDGLTELLEAPLYTLPQELREARLKPVLEDLTAHHRAHCEPYRRMVDSLHPGEPVPRLPVGLFKRHVLSSVPDEDITTVLTSSGTTGQVPSRIVLDGPTSERQSRALTRIMTEVLGPKRLPMILFDSRAILADRRSFSARAAGVLGMMRFGARPFFALDADLNLDVEGLKAFLTKWGERPFVMFGFTFMAWQALAQLAEHGLDLSNGTLIHSGGWKKLVDQQVDNPTFKRMWSEKTGLSRITNFYGMVEQVGSVFVEGDDGLLHPPAFADVIVRDPLTYEEVGPGEVGVLQVVSALPTSYPGHSLLTEDLGVVQQIDEGPWLGKGFSVLGRLPRSELRGCSDTQPATVAEVA